MPTEGGLGTSFAKATDFYVLALNDLGRPSFNGKHKLQKIVEKLKLRVLWEGETMTIKEHFIWKRQIG
jgi:hypothetical protein